MRMRYLPVALAIAAASSPAFAVDVDTFNFSGALLDRQGNLQVSNPHIGKGNTYYAGLGLSLAARPLVLLWPDDHEDAVVNSQFSTRLMAGYNILGRARLDLEVPVYPAVTVNGTSSFAMGAIRLGAMVPIVSYEESGVGLGLAPFLELPTGSPAAFLSDGGFSGGLLASVGGTHGRFGWSAEGGVDLGPRDELDPTVVLGNSILTGANLHFKVADPLTLGAEAHSVLTFTDGFSPWNKQDVEAHLYGTHAGSTGLVVTLGVGTGLLAGVGAPDYRALLAIGYRSPDGPDDTDGDGIFDNVDQCPTDPEDIDQFEDANGCPDPDNDQDTILDVSDACPNDPEDFDKFEDENGCPDPDNDQDGILDVNDACPNDPGPAVTQGCPDRDGDTVADRDDECPDDPGPVETKGCPDADGDLVPDFRDKCPNQPIDKRADPARSDGCPTRVVVTRAQIVILEKIFFDFNKSTIKPVSFPLLAEVAQVINANPQIKLIEVAGHTDNVGSDEYNLKLSQARVDAVLKHLVSQGGVDASRLVAKGYGETKPIDTNDTEEGRAMNRRVEFNILQQD